MDESVMLRLKVFTVLTPIIGFLASADEMLRWFSANSIIVIVGMFLWIICIVGILPFSVNKAAKEKNRKSGWWSFAAFLLPNGLFSPLYFLFVIGRAFSVPLLLLDIGLSLSYAVIPLCLHILPRKLSGGGRIWRCPECGTLLEKSGSSDKIDWELLKLARMTPESKTWYDGTVACGKCGRAFPRTEVYLENKYDV